jgi:hypothetical protein
MGDADEPTLEELWEAKDREIDRLADIISRAKAEFDTPVWEQIAGVFDKQGWTYFARSILVRIDGVRRILAEAEGPEGG